MKLHSFPLSLLFGVFVMLISCEQNTNVKGYHDIASNPPREPKQDSLIYATNLNILVYQIGIPPLDSFRMFPETVLEIKKDKSKPTFLKFRHGGTETDISIIDSSNAINYKNTWNCPSFKHLSFDINESGLIEISDLKSGTYFISYSSCYTRGTYKLILRD